MTALVSFDRVFEVLDLPSLIEEKPDAAVLPVAPPPGVRPRRLHLPGRRGGVPRVPGDRRARRVARGGPGAARRHVHRRAGQMIALVGPSGAGKTTVTHLVARLYDASAGAVRVGGLDVRDVTLESLEDVVGYVTQDAHMFHDTIRTNLLYARPDADEAAIWEAMEAAQIADAGAVAARRPRHRRRRPWLPPVRRRAPTPRDRPAAAQGPSIVVLDEATAHLDSESEAAVQRALDAALASRTSLVIAHRLSTVRNADLILVLDAGRVVQSGTHAELIAQGGLYRTLHDTQFRGPGRRPQELVCALLVARGHASTRDRCRATCALPCRRALRRTRDSRSRRARAGRRTTTAARRRSAARCRARAAPRVASSTSGAGDLRTEVDEAGHDLPVQRLADLLAVDRRGWTGR